MLSDQVRQLITAFVDGELNTRQRQEVQRLIERSPEARSLLRKLQDDAERLRRLPFQSLDDGFADRVVQAIRPRTVSRRLPEPTISLWRASAAAAILLVCVGAGSFLFVRSHLDTQPSNDLVEISRPDVLPEPPSPGPQTSGPAVVVTPTREATSPVPPESIERLDVLPTAVVLAPTPTPTPTKPDPSTPEKAVLTSQVPDMEMFRPSVAPVTVFPLLNVRELDATKLAVELQKATALRIELPCRETARAFRRMEAAFKEAGATLVVDASAQNRLGKPRLKGNYVLFVEDITPEELARLLARVGAEDRKAADLKPKPDAQFSKLILNRMSDADRKELLDLFRADTRPLTAVRPEAGKPTPRPAERLVLAAGYNPERPRSGSLEVKRFFDARRSARPGTLQALLVLREAPL